MNRMMRIAALAAVSILGAAGAQAQTYTAKMGIATLNDVQHVWLKNYAAALEKDSGGRIKSEIYPASQLGTIPRMIEQTQFGAIQLWAGPPEFLYGVDPRFELLAAPGVFKSVEQTQAVLQDPEFQSKFLAIGEPKGLVGVGLFFNGPEAFDMRKPLHTVAEFDGLKIRVLASPMQIDPLHALKAAPVPMSLGEVLPALQQGALDGVMGDLPVLQPLGYASAAKYFIDTRHAMVTSMAVVSRKWLRSLPADLQKIVIDDGRKQSASIFPTAMKLMNDAYAAWTAAGGEVIKLSPEEQAKLMGIMAPSTEQVIAAHPEEKPMYEALLAAIKRNP